MKTLEPRATRSQWILSPRRTTREAWIKLGLKMEKLEAMGNLTLEERESRPNSQISLQGRAYQGPQRRTSRDMTNSRLFQVSVSAVQVSRPSVNEVILNSGWSSPQGNNLHDHLDNQAFLQNLSDVKTLPENIHRHTLHARPLAYQPSTASPLRRNGLRNQSTTAFVPCQPVQLAPSNSKLPPWRIDKGYRYTTVDTFSKREGGGAQSTSTPRGRWKGSSPSKVPQHNIRSHASRTASPTPGLEKKSRSLPHRGLPKSLPVPIPSQQYLAMASRPPNKLAAASTLLLALDLNGTLLYRELGSKAYSPRPSLDRFLAYCLEHHRVLIWSSAKAVNVDAICHKIFTLEKRRKLLGIWARESLGLSESQFEGKVQIYKSLTSIWDHKPIQRGHPNFDRGGRWSQENTVLIDDSLIKAKGHPYNLIQCPEYVTSKNGVEAGDVLGQIVAYLEEARWCDNVSSFIKNIYKFEIDKGWAWDWERNQRQKVTSQALDAVKSDKVLGASTVDGKDLAN